MPMPFQLPEWLVNLGLVLMVITAFGVPLLVVYRWNKAPMGSDEPWDGWR